MSGRTRIEHPDAYLSRVSLNGGTRGDSWDSFAILKSASAQRTTRAGQQIRHKPQGFRSGLHELRGPV
jgi:hypothetical protein